MSIHIRRISRTSRIEVVGEEVRGRREKGWQMKIEKSNMKTIKQEDIKDIDNTYNILVHVTHPLSKLHQKHVARRPFTDCLSFKLLYHFVPYPSYSFDSFVFFFFVPLPFELTLLLLRLLCLSISSRACSHATNSFV